jgi:hypothetical protein
MKPEKRKTKGKDFKDKSLRKFEESEKWKRVNREKKRK